MNILIAGDSWTYGYGVEDKTKIWPHVLSNELNSEYILVAKSGAANEEIAEYTTEVIENEKDNLDLVIVGWSGTSRIIYEDTPNSSRQFSLSYVPDEDNENRKDWFEKHSLQFLLNKWEKEITSVYNLCQQHSIKLINFSVFGDKFPVNLGHTVNTSYMEFLANIDNTSFQYEIPLFEFDFLHEKNNVTKNFLNRYLNRHWELACAERELWYGNTSLLEFGHPTIESHQLWANFLLKIIKEQYD